MRYLGTEQAIYTTPAEASRPVFQFLRFEGSSLMKAAYRLGIRATQDPNNRGYMLIYSIDGQSQPDLPVVDGQEILLPANGNLFSGVLIPVGPNGPRSDKQSELVQFTTEVYVDTPPPPPPPPPPADVLQAPTPELSFQGFRDDDGNPIA